MKKDNTVTIYDIAEMAGTSPRSVTRAFQDSSEISEKTKQRILEIASRVGYRPNKVAGRMCGKPLVIGYIIVGSVDVFSLELIRGAKMAADALADFKTEILIRHCRTVQEGLTAIEELLSYPIDGLLYYGGKSAIQILDSVAEKGIPIATTVIGTGTGNIKMHITVDTERKGRMGASLLSMLNPSGPIAYFAGDLEEAHHASILDGFRAEAKKCDMDISAVFNTEDDSRCAEEQAMKLIRDYPPCSSVFFASANSVSAIEVFRRHGYHPTIIASDVFPQMSKFIRDGTVSATIYQNPAKQARLGMMHLYEYVTEKKQHSPQILITPQIVIRSNLDVYEYQGSIEL